MFENETKLTPALWNSRKKDLYDFIMEDFEEIDLASLAGEEVLLVASKIANYFKDGSQAQGKTFKQQAKLWTSTQSRHYGNNNFSACSELVQSTLNLMGLQDNSLLNRDNPDFNETPGASWKIGMSVPKMISGGLKIGKELGQQVWVQAKVGILPETGNMCLIGENGTEHVFVVNRVEDGIIYSTDMGQVDQGGQCAKERTRKIEIINNQVWTISMENGQPNAAGLGKRRLIGWLDVSAMIPKFTGKCYVPR